MVRQIKQHRKDCKYYVEEAMEKLGYNVNSRKQNKLENKTCQVYYGDFDTAIVTQMSYWNEIPITIEFDIDDNEDVPYYIMQVQAFITWYVYASQCDYATGFYFNHVHNDFTGESTHVTMIGIWQIEVDFALENEIAWCGDNLDPDTVKSVLDRVRLLY